MITSSSNEKIKYLKKLKQTKYIKEEKKFIVEGKHIILEAKKQSKTDYELVIVGDGPLKKDLENKVKTDNMINNLPEFNFIFGLLFY